MSTEAIIEAFYKSDSSYDETIFAGVKTTGIYCFPSCKAKKPLLSNVEWFTTREEAEAYGLRPCKSCHSGLPKASWEDQRDALVVRVADSAELLQLENKVSSLQVEGAELQVRLHPAQDGALRIELLQPVMKKSTRAQLARAVLERVTGRAQIAVTTEDRAYHHSELGWMEIKGVKGKITSMMFVEGEGEEAPAAATTPLPDYLATCTRQLDEYFQGKRAAFDLPLHSTGTPFQKRVWEELLTIPCGETRSYSDLAQAIGKEKAVRAVGSANGKNLLSIVVPCHRVIGSNGKLTGYAGELWRKEWLLEHERKMSLNRV